MPPPDPSPPPGRRRPRITSGAAAALVAAGGVLGGVLLFVFVLNVIGSGKARSPTGTELFVLGRAKPLAGSVDREGPLLLPDPLGRGRNVYVQHLGGNEWRTIDVRPPGAPARCLVVWQPGTRTYVDKCSSRVFPADGTGLTTFPTRVDSKGRIVVDLRHPQLPTTTGPAITGPTTTRAA